MGGLGAQRACCTSCGMGMEHLSWFDLSQSLPPPLWQAGGQAGSWMSASEEDTLAAALGRSSEVVRAAQGVLGATLVAAEQRVGMERLLELSRQLAQAAVHAQVR